jgi:hypothetical protein
MPNKTLLVAAVAISAAVYFGFLKSAEPDKTIDTLASKSGNAARVDQVVLAAGERGDLPEGKAHGRLNFDFVKNQSDLEREVLKSDVSPGQGLEYLKTAALYCEARKLATLNLRPKDAAPSAARVESDRYQKEFVARFCNDGGQTAEQIAARVKSVDAADDMNQILELGNLEGDDNKSIGIPRAASLAAESSDPDVIVRAALYLADFGKDIPQAASVPAPNAMQDAQRLPAQILAANMAACSLRGGCGENGLYTVLECSALSACRPGVTALDVWQRSYSPAQMAYARSLATEIVRTRKKS